MWGKSLNQAYIHVRTLLSGFFLFFLRAKPINSVRGAVSVGLHATTSKVSTLQDKLVKFYDSLTLKVTALEGHLSIIFLAIKLLISVENVQFVNIKEQSLYTTT